MKKAPIITPIILALCGCASHKGAIKPNWGLADFDKYNEAYYLSLDQIAIGDSKDIVIDEYGSKFEIKEINNEREQWTFKSYRATSFTDPVGKLVYVEFSNGKVVNKSEILLRRSGQPQAKQTDPIEQIERLKELRDAGAITGEEFQLKKKELLDRI